MIVLLLIESVPAISAGRSARRSNGSGTDGINQAKNRDFAKERAAGSSHQSA